MTEILNVWLALHVQALWGKEFEAHSLKGMAIGEYASEGGRTAAAAHQIRSEPVLAEMERLIEDGHTIRAEANIAAKRTGKNPEACRTLWYRRRGRNKKL